MMLSRIAQGLFQLGRRVERAQHVARILEVNHKMNLERASPDDAKGWAAIAESFDCGLDQPDEEALYGELVLSGANSHSVRRCIGAARDEGRSMREHISEEMWLHLNRTHLLLAELSFESILRIGRSEFNRRIEVFGNAFYGMADDTMIRGESWAFLRLGKLAERALMICRILEIGRQSLALGPGSEGAPAELHQWQALLRSLSGYEPYRRAYDARIVPERVLRFVLQSPDFPRSLRCTLSELGGTLDAVSHGNPHQVRLAEDVDRALDELRRLDAGALLRGGGFETGLRDLDRRCRAISGGFALAYFTSLRPPSVPISAVPGAALVPQ